MNRQGRQSSTDDVLIDAALALSLLKPLSPKTLLQSLLESGNALNLLTQAEHILALLHPDSRRHYTQWREQRQYSELGQSCATILDQCQKLPCSIVPLGSSDYPSLLTQIASPPPLLYVRGNKNALHLPSIAIVGARQCTTQGGQNAERFAHELARGGFAVTSGLALGIDGQAHTGALSAQGTTVGVMATGIDRIYPSRHKRLAEEILATEGCIITEMPLSSPPLKAHFPRRNRIISGLSLGVLVVEAKVKSGSLLTAYASLKQNREVFAIPGSIHNPMAKGCHQLIKEGAKLVETTEDIIQELGGSLELLRPSPKLAQPEPNQSDHPILSALGFEARSLDELADLLDTPMEELLVEVLNLELEGKVSQSEGMVARLD